MLVKVLARAERARARAAVCVSVYIYVLGVCTLQLSAAGDAELAHIRAIVAPSFSSKIMSVDDAHNRTKHAFSEYHDPAKKAVSKFWDHADFQCYNTTAGFASWGARNC